MAQSLENKFLTNGSGLGFPNNPTQPIPAGVGPSPAAKGSTLHDLYSYDGNPNSSKLLTALPISSATPHEKPAAFDALFDVVSISLRDCMIN